ncbi:hypothetical protein ES708_09539 [subsurface metagenome]
MKQKYKAITRIEDKIRDSKFADTVLSMFKVGLSVTTYAPFANLISEFIPSRRLLRLEKFAKDLADDLKNIEDKIDTDFITTEEFAFIFENCFKAASECYQQEKLKSFRAIIINSAINDRFTNYEREFYLILTNSLTEFHIKVLKFICYPNKYLSENNISENIINGEFSTFIMKVFEGIMLGTITLAFDDLFKYGLIDKDFKSFNLIINLTDLKSINNSITYYGAACYHFISIEEN